MINSTNEKQMYYLNFLKKYITLDNLYIDFIFFKTTQSKELLNNINNEKDCQNLLMNIYNNNIFLLKKYYKIKSYTFSEFINKLNNNKKIHIFFEQVDVHNLKYYYELYKSID